MRPDGLEEWQDVVLSRPADNVGYGGVETEVLLQNNQSAPIYAPIGDLYVPSPQPGGTAYG
jgi:hypothetical protein